ncbi:MAG: ABC transporter permease [Gammaproteobacteria bacterium]|nr:ABC transporter permease [Gammaproteobacteria bacterium]
MSQVFNSIFGWPGSFVIRRLDYLVNVTTFVCFVLRDWFARAGLIYRYSYRPLITQIIFTGVDALPTVVFLGFITGFILTFRMIELFDSVGDAVTMLQYMIGLEIGPMMAAIILISRTASAITVDIGNMKLHKEIQSLELMGVDINETLIAPRILGVTISQVVVAVYFTFVTLASGILLSGLLISPDHYSYFLKLADSAEPMMLLLFVVKNMLFGLTIGTVSCYHGLSVGTSATEVPQQTQRAIVSILIMLFIIDSVIVMVLLS